MNELAVSTLLESLPGAAAEIERRTLADVGAAVCVLSSGAARRGIADGTDIAGQAFKPLSHARSSGGAQPLRDKGLLAASLSAARTETEIVLSANAPGARVLNYGGVITPKRAKALTIPVTKEAQRIGSPGRGRFPRPLFRVAGNGGKPGVLAENVNGVLVVHYVLALSVTLPPRNYLGWRPDTLATISRMVGFRYCQIVAQLFRTGRI